MKRDQVHKGQESNHQPRIGGWAGWLMRWAAARLGKLRRSERTQPRLVLIERITLAPKQSLALVEAEGRRVLVAVSAEGGSAFFMLDDAAHLAGTRQTTPPGARRGARISW